MTKIAACRESGTSGLKSRQIDEGNDDLGLAGEFDDGEVRDLQMIGTLPHLLDEKTDQFTRSIAACFARGDGGIDKEVKMT